LRSRTAFHSFKCFCSGFRLQFPFSQKSDPTKYRVERRAKLVRNGGQELILHSIGGFGLDPCALLRLVEACMFDRYSYPIGSQLQHFDVFLGEAMRLESVNVNHANHPVINDQWSAKK